MKKMVFRKFKFHLYDLSEEKSLSICHTSTKFKEDFKILVADYLTSDRDGRMRVICVEKRFLSVHVHCVLDKGLKEIKNAQ